MTTNVLDREIFLVALEKLPDENIKELLDFTEFLLLKEQSKKSKLLIDPKKDPILKLIGLANEEPFADKIDEDLYGE
ncbi:MAG: DUF2281 domain-containing protein [Candidatus Methanoperedens sp.]|nr:DUF2281 domain-containing protein [Candidatus Methanoperedens sp.]